MSGPCQDTFTHPGQSIPCHTVGTHEATGKGLSWCRGTPALHGVEEVSFLLHPFLCCGVQGANEDLTL